MISRIMILMLTGLLSAAAGAVEIEGVKLADTAAVAGRDLLNGAGLRKRLLFHVYVASLYLPEKVSAAAAVLKAEPRRVRIDMLREVGADDFPDALKDGIEANASQTELVAIQPQVSEFAAVITATGETKEGDTIMLDFVGGSTVVTINGVEKTRIAGEGFNRALLKIWLGDHPVQADLKTAMLGGCEFAPRGDEGTSISPGRRNGRFVRYLRPGGLSLISSPFCAHHAGEFEGQREVVELDGYHGRSAAAQRMKRRYAARYVASRTSAGSGNLNVHEFA